MPCFAFAAEFRNRQIAFVTDLYRDRAAAGFRVSIRIARIGAGQYQVAAGPGHRLVTEPPFAEIGADGGELIYAGGRQADRAVGPGVSRPCAALRPPK